MLVDRLALVVVLGMELAVRPGYGLRRLIGLEAQISLLVLIGLGIVTLASVTLIEPATTRAAHID